MFALAYDSDQDEVVGFGGVGPAGYLGDTWVWSQSLVRWRATRPPQSPPPRSHHSIVYDRARKQIVLFGGYSTDGMLGDTWTWDGTTWSAYTGVSPPPRRSAQLGYDVVRQRVVLFGGTAATTLTIGNAPGLTDTWEWDGTAWSERSPATMPPGARSTQLVYDIGRSEMIACISDGPATSAQTWRWDGANWTDLQQPCPSGSDSDSVAVYDPLTMLVTLHTRSRTLHTWNGSQWSSITPVDISMPGLAHDGTSLLLVGGHASGTLSDPAGYTNATRVRISSVWGSLTDATLQPPKITQAAAAFAPRHGRALMFGGLAAGVTLDVTWAWTTGGWQKLATTTRPPGSRNAGLAYDEGRDRFVMFGGANISDTQRTWELDGTDWTEKLGPQPPARTSPSMTYDGGRGVVLLFGGQPSSATVHDDFWSWNGTTWAELTPTPSPPGRSHAALGYDPVRDRVVMFGGQVTIAGYLDDTWEWDGSAWSQREPEGGVRPAPRGGARFVFHPLRQRMWLHGGNSFANLQYFSDVWEWDGVRWTLLHDDPRLARHNHVAFFDTLRGGLVTFGGVRDQVTGDVAETWLLALDAAGAGETCSTATVDADNDGLAGCLDPDCFGWCTPQCPPATSCAGTAPHCGDGSCNSELEDYALCAADCT
jgi:hypothetical protein